MGRVILSLPTFTLPTPSSTIHSPIKKLIDYITPRVRARNARSKATKDHFEVTGLAPLVPKQLTRRNCITLHYYESVRSYHCLNQSTVSDCMRIQRPRPCGARLINTTHLYLKMFGSPCLNPMTLANHETSCAPQRCAPRTTKTGALIILRNGQKIRGRPSTKTLSLVPK